MSTDRDAPGDLGLSALGERIELLRIERGRSKQQLAREAGVSRQQLWRVLTGKAEPSGPLTYRLAAALGVDPRFLQPSPLSREQEARSALADTGRAPELERWLRSGAALETTLRTLPGGAGGMWLKRELLNLLEVAASQRGILLPRHFFELRRKVLAGAL